MRSACKGGTRWNSGKILHDRQQLKEEGGKLHVQSKLIKANVIMNYFKIEKVTYCFWKTIHMGDLQSKSRHSWASGLKPCSSSISRHSPYPPYSAEYTGLTLPSPLSQIRSVIGISNSSILQIFKTSVFWSYATTNLKHTASFSQGHCSFGRKLWFFTLEFVAL